MPIVITKVAQGIVVKQHGQYADFDWLWAVGMCVCDLGEA
jgi:hypothetical protein